MRGQEEIIEPQNVSEVGQNVSVPCDQPAQGEDSAHLGPVNQRIKTFNTRPMTNIISIISLTGFPHNICKEFIIFDLTVFSGWSDMQT